MNKLLITLLLIFGFFLFAAPVLADNASCDADAQSAGYDYGTCTSACETGEDDLGDTECPNNTCCAGHDAGVVDTTAEETTEGTYLVPACAINDPASCGLCDLVQFIVDATQFLAGGVAAFALLFFIIGGFYWIFSAGNEQRITTGKKIMIGSITGVVIVFLAWIIVNTVILTVSTGGDDFGGQAELFPNATKPASWFEVECFQYE